MEKPWQKEGHEITRDRPRVRAGVLTQTSHVFSRYVFCLPDGPTGEASVHTSRRVCVSFRVSPSLVTNRKPHQPHTKTFHFKNKVYGRIKTYTKRPWFCLTNNRFVSMRSWCTWVCQEIWVTMWRWPTFILLKQECWWRKLRLPSWPAHQYWEPGTLNIVRQTSAACELNELCENTNHCALQHQHHSLGSRNRYLWCTQTGACITM